MRYSILIPAYKAKYLRECIDSILAQSCDDFEIIIVNDASPENLDAIVKQYSDFRISYYVNKENCGALHVVDNWNKCLSYAQGDYVICMGDDDMLLPNCLEEYNNLIEQFPTLDIYHGWTLIIDENSHINDVNDSAAIYESVYSLIYYRLKGRQQYIGDFLYKTSSLRKNGGFYDIPMAWGSDDITCYISAMDKGIANTQTPVFLYRKTNITLSKSGNMQIQMEGINKTVDWLKKFLERKPIQEIDTLYYCKIKKTLEKYTRTRKIATINKDLSYNGLANIFFWIFNMKKYNIKRTDIIKSTLLFLTRK